MGLDERNKALDEKLEGGSLNQAVETLVRDAKKVRRNQRILALSIALDVFLTFALAGMSLVTHSIATKAETTQATLLKTCQVTNESRANNAVLWDYLIDQSKNQPRTPDQQKFFDDFVELKKKTFAPRDCSQVK